MAKYFELTGETKVNEFGVTLHRIRCTQDTRWAKAGDLGGWLESESNLCDGAWVDDEAQVFGDARVYGDALVFGGACVYDAASVYESALVYGDALIFGGARVYGAASVYECALVYGDARVSGAAWVYGDARVSGAARVYGYARVYGSARVYGRAVLGGHAAVENNAQHCGFDCFGSANRHTHAYLTESGDVEVICGCFRGSLDEFAQQVHKTHAGTVYERQYMTMIGMIKLKFGLML